MNGDETRGGLTLAEIAAAVGGEVEGDPTTVIRTVAGVDDARSDSLVRVERKQYLAAALTGPGAAFLVGPGVPQTDRPAVRVRDPRLAFALCLERLSGEDPDAQPAEPRIHPTAVVADDAVLEADVTLHAGVVIGARSRIGAGCVLHANVVIGPDVEIGAGSVLFPNVTIYRDVRIGRRARLHAGVVIGADGFGYVWDGSRQRKIPHVGRVEIGDDVEMGANASVDRATTGVTIVGDGTKLDNMVQVGHNARLGPHCMIAAHTAIGGSAVLGARVVMGGHSAVREHVRLADDVLVAGKSGVWTDLSRPGVYSGNPAQPHFQEERRLVNTRHVPELVRRIRELELAHAVLQQQLTRDQPPAEPPPAEDNQEP